MAKSSEEYDKFWAFMTRVPPASWESAHMKFLIDYARLTARSMGAGEHQADDISLVVAFKIVECNWWSNPGENPESPQAFKGYIYVAVRRQLIDQYRKSSLSEQREVSIEGSGGTGAELPRLEPLESRPDFNPEAAMVHNHIDPDTINEIHQVLSDFIGTLSDASLETVLFIAEYTGVSEDPSNSSVHFLADFIGILSGSLRPKDFVEGMMAAQPQLNRNQARKRLQRVQRTFRPFNQKLRGLF